MKKKKKKTGSSYNGLCCNNRKKMPIRIVHIVLLAALNFHRVSPATIESVRLIGDTSAYMTTTAKSPYVLQCNFRAGYDDPVSSVNWYKDNNLVYSWRQGETVSTAFGVLYDHVLTAEKPSLQNLYFSNKASFNLTGNYTCEVESQKGKTRSEPFPILVLDVPSDNYVTKVSLMGEESNPENSTATKHESSNCTLLWDFITPAIFPRPNVTCGYYSYLHQDVTDEVPAGLTMHLLVNQSWQASFYHTHIQVSDIPRKSRLGCVVKIPATDYQKVVKFEDNFVIDHLIDEEEGCPALFLDPMNKLRFSLSGGNINCRGDLVPTETNSPIRVSFKCSPNDLAVFPNGTAVPDWSDEMTCDPTVRVWKRTRDVNDLSSNITEALPVCLPWRSEGARPGSSASLVLALYLCLCVSRSISV